MQNLLRIVILVVGSVAFGVWIERAGLLRRHDKRATAESQAHWAAINAADEARLQAELARVKAEHSHYQQAIDETWVLAGRPDRAQDPVSAAFRLRLKGRNNGEY